MAKRKSEPAGAYRVIRGLAWPNPAGGEFEALLGETRTDLPPQYVGEWIEIGAIEPADTAGEPVMEEA